MSKKYYLSLGAGDQQIPLIQAAKKKGYTVIACDQKLNALGLKQADMQIQCSIVDPRSVIRLVHENILPGELVGVGCRSHGQALRSAMVIAKYFSVPYTEPRHVKIFQDKYRLKKILTRNGIPMVESTLDMKELGQKNLASRQETWATMVASKVPLVVRPTHSHGKQGVEMLSSFTEAMDFFSKVETNLSSYLVEPYVRGSEITVIGTVSNGRCEVICITDKDVNHYEPWFVEIRHSYPSSISNFLCQKIPAMMQKICQVTGLLNGPIVAEFLIPKSVDKNMSPLYLIECQPEVGGEYIADQLLPHVMEIDYFTRLVEISSVANSAGDTDEPRSSKAKKSAALNTDFTDLALGGKWVKQPRRRFIIRYLHQTQDGILRELEYPKRKLSKENPFYVFHRSLKSPMHSIRLSNRNLDRLFVFGMSALIAETVALEEQIEEIANEIQIIYE